MKITKEQIRALLKEYMLDNDLSYMEIDASLSHDKQKLIMSVKEEETPDALGNLLN